MRTIPASILNKLKLLQQTKANNADPRINLVMQRTRRYIEQGSTLNPVTLWDRPGLGSIDISYRRESRMTAPDKIYVVYIESGEAHVARTDYIKSIEQANEWEYLYSLGPAVDVAIEFDGRWERASKDAEVCFDAPAQWTHVTMGDPYIFLVTASGDLIVRQGQGEPVLLAEGVTKVAALRGWKNVYRWNHDHGLICAYIREGAVYYRNYANQGTEQNPLPPVWEQERLVDTLPTPAVNVGLFRTNDFRVGFLCESDGEIYWTVTDRNWAGMAIRDHTVRARGEGVMALLTRIFYHDRYSPPHTIQATGTDVACMLCPEIYPQVIGVRNIDEQTILIYTDLPLVGDLTGLESAFSVTDELSANYPVSATKRGAVFPSRLFTFERNSVAYHPDTGEEIPEDTPVFVDFADGRLGSLMVEGTENLLTENQSSVEVNTTGFSSLGATISREIGIAWHGEASVKVVTDDDRNNRGINTYEQGVVGDQTYTFSVWLKGSGTVRLGLLELRSDSSEVGRSYGSVITLTENWQRYSITRMFAVDGVKLRGLIYTDVPQVATFYADGFQLERSAYPTPWHIGGSTRANPLKRITLPEALPATFGIGLSTKMLHAHDTATRTFWQAGDYRCYFDSTDNKLKITNGVVTAQTAVAWAADDIVGVYAGRKNRKLFVQAKIAGTVGDCAIAPCGEIESGTTLYLGSKADGSESVNAVIGDFVLHDPHEIDADAFFAIVPDGGGE